MKFFEKVKRFFDRYFFFDKWTCNVCNKEIFTDGYFCDKCESELPYNDKFICNHCGRETLQNENFCLSCKERQLFVDTARSSFTYKEPISLLIQKYKYNGKRYLADLFVNYMFITATKNFFAPDFIVFVPMTEKALKKRGFNHGELLARKLAEKMNVEVYSCIKKVKETKRQAKSTAKERRENLKGCFRLTNKKKVKEKTVLLVDDVLTTGATSETIAEILKKAGAKKVLLLTVASVPSKR